MAQIHTRGVGVYPGDPREDFSPVSRIDNTTYRNLALHRAAWHSSSYDYNLTAQLVTDGIREQRPPRWLSVGSSQKPVLDRNEREWLLDSNWVTSVDVAGPKGWVQAGFLGGDGPVAVDRIDLDARLDLRNNAQPGYALTVSVSDDGASWTEAARLESRDAPKREFFASIPLAPPVRARWFRVSFEAPAVAMWRIGGIAPFFLGEPLRLSGPHPFASAWKSAGAGEEWVRVDLGADCAVDRFVLHWVWRPAEGRIQISQDGTQWRDAAPLPAHSALVDELKLPAPLRARHVRVLMTKPANPEGYILSELEAWGRGGPVWSARPLPSVAGGRLRLSGGWSLQRASLVAAPAAEISRPGFPAEGWIPATVPGTVLVSYLNIGAIPDPNFADNQLMISDSFFHSDFWYRNEFTAPSSLKSEKIWLHFAGINWKAEVWLNGEFLGLVEGAFRRGRFDLSGRIRLGERNALAVKILKNATPGSVKEKTFDNPDKNGGALGADNPTFHASIGWDWIPTIRGRNTGIWNEVWIESGGPVTLRDPLVASRVGSDARSADVRLEFVVENHAPRAVWGVLRGAFGDRAFSQDVALEAGETRSVPVFLKLDSPRLWWPNGYGEPYLYPVEARFESGGAVSSRLSFQAGVREFTYSEEGGALRMWINGRRFIPRGGNWGFSESLLRYRSREYDAAVRYHRHQNFTMIRNWVGMIGEDAFYEACDRYGIVVWQDFWLANPWDGPDPDDHRMFLDNARDLLLRIRHHASVGLYCGRNEGFPPPPIDRELRRLTAELHPGMHYISSSADEVVSGHGPYRAMPLEYYFRERATPKFHSEMGMPNIVHWDSLREFIPEEQAWPQGRLWGLHDFCLTGAQGGASFRELIEKRFGPASGAREWVQLAQFLNYDGYRAMFEAQSRNRMGLLIWMSHPAWPSFVWQTYDYYLEPTAAYFGARKANEPLHIQWNPATGAVEVVNYHAGDVRGLSATARILGLKGEILREFNASLDSREDSVSSPIALELPKNLPPVYFIRLELRRGNDLVSSNFYMRSASGEDFTALRRLPQVRLEAATRTWREGGRWLLETSLRNPAETPALMIRLAAVRARSGDRILPAIYSDNYFPLMPGESVTVITEVQEADCRGEEPSIRIEGFNAAPAR
ncbi:MAG: discoidin domain-containing protein [Bryobacteraceae bacterium]|nr:discoidin domain-containing protein [Bryobacteraceae bacterium]